MTIVRGTDTGFNTTVTPGATILFVTFRSEDGSLPSAQITWALTDGNTITITRNSSTGAVVCFWTLVSFASGVVVQHKSITLSTTQTTNTAAIDAPSVGGGRWIIAGGCTSPSSDPNRNWGRWAIDSDTQISVTRAFQDGGDAATYKCQVVEYSGATVQVVSKTLTSTIGTTDDTTVTAVDLAKTVLFGSCSSFGSDFVSDVAWTMDLTSTTNFRVQRNGTTSVTVGITAYVVEFTDGTEVRRNAVSHAAQGVGDPYSVNTTITAVVTARSVAIMAGMCNVGLSSGRSAGANALLWLRHLVTSELTATTTHQSTRHNGFDAQDYHSQVIQFPAAVSTTQRRTFTRTLGRALGRGFQ